MCNDDSCFSRTDLRVALVLLLDSSCYGVWLRAFLLIFLDECGDLNHIMYNAVGLV